MEYSNNKAEIKINVQTVDLTSEGDLKNAHRKSISRLSRYSDRIEWADVYFEDKEENSTKQKRMSIRHSVPDKGLLALECGDNFNYMLTRVQDKLRS